MTIALPARPAVAMPVPLTVRTVLSVLVQAALVTATPVLLVTVSGRDSPLRRTERDAVICRAPPDGAVGVEELSQPERINASPANAVATRRDVTGRL